MAMKLRLGASLGAAAPLNGMCTRCGKPCDERGLHALVCKSTGGKRNSRHKAVKYSLMRVVRQVPSVSVLNEPPVDQYYKWRAAVPRDQRTNRRADVAVIDQDQAEGPTSLIDIVVEHRGQEACAEEGATATVAASGEAKKISLYTKLFTMNNADIIPFAMESNGALGPLGMGFLKRMVDAAQAREKRVNLQWMLEDLSASFQRSNADVLLAYHRTS